MRPAQAIAHSNIALVKYWGKRTDVDPTLNLPAVGSLSMTLDGLWTETAVASAPADRFVLDGEVRCDEAASRVWAHLDRMWLELNGPGARPRLEVVSTNHLPTAAGLASSASGFAALTLAAAAAFEAPCTKGELAAWARRGSGSAARSLHGGFVRLDAGSAPDGSDCRVRPLWPATHWDVRLLVVQTAKGPKPIGSRDGMERSRRTSPYYGPWVHASLSDLDAAEDALARRDLGRLGPIVEHSCFKMHACMLATMPPILYWTPATVAAIHAVWEARGRGLPGYVTIDAGPHVKVLCSAEHAEPLAEHLRGVAGVREVTVCRPGPDARATPQPLAEAAVPDQGLASP